MNGAKVILLVLLLAGCGDEVTPAQWSAMERACIPYGGISYSISAGVFRHGPPAVGYEWTKVRCQDGTTIVVSSVSKP